MLARNSYGFRHSCRQSDAHFCFLTKYALSRSTAHRRQPQPNCSQWIAWPSSVTILIKRGRAHHCSRLVELAQATSPITLPWSDRPPPRPRAKSTNAWMSNSSAHPRCFSKANAIPIQITVSSNCPSLYQDLLGRHLLFRDREISTMAYRHYW